MTAQKLRMLLLASIIGLVLIAGAVFWLIRGHLMTFAHEVQQSNAEANSSTQNLATLEHLKTQLSQDADTVERTKNIVAESKSYAYQDQIIKDINTYASRSGVSVSGYTFSADTGATAGTAVTSTPPAASTQATAGAKTVTGLKSVSVSVNLKSPVKYESVMNFIHSIEQNLTKMQLAGISLTKDPTSDNVTASALTIEVYTR